MDIPAVGVQPICKLDTNKQVHKYWIINFYDFLINVQYSIFQSQQYHYPSVCVSVSRIKNEYERLQSQAQIEGVLRGIEWFKSFGALGH